MSAMLCQRRRGTMKDLSETGRWLVYRAPTLKLLSFIRRCRVFNYNSTRMRGQPPPARKLSKQQKKALKPEDVDPTPLYQATLKTSNGELAKWLVAQAKLPPEAVLPRKCIYQQCPNPDHDPDPPKAKAEAKVAELTAAQPQDAKALEAANKSVKDLSNEKTAGSTLLASNLGAALKAAGYPAKADMAKFDKVTVVIILNVGGTVLGAVVDAVADVVALTPDAIKPAPQFESQVDSAFVTGIATVGDRMLIMMDIESLLSSAEMGLVAQVAQ